MDEIRLPSDAVMCSFYNFYWKLIYSYDFPMKMGYLIYLCHDIVFLLSSCVFIIYSDLLAFVRVVYWLHTNYKGVEGKGVVIPGYF